ncbi:tetratricopeptide repeat protein [Streptomyces lydicus]|uniref:tetratricopeptide repeat protein n=1 Tax=Streptomyces lydicus TaxID=47763 RepID=UPI0037A977C3
MTKEASRLLAQEMAQEAIEKLDTAISVDSNTWRPYELRALCLLRLNSYERALTDSDKAVALSPGKTQKAHSLLIRASAKEELKDYAAALSDCRALNVRHLSDAEKITCWGIMGRCYFNMGEFAQVVTIMSRALKLEPDNSWDRLRRSAAYRKLGKRREALKDCEYVLSRDPENNRAKKELEKLSS